VTLHNWMKTYNPGLQGGATGTTVPLTKGAWLDAAVSEGKIQQWPDQLAYLVKQLQGQYAKNVDFQKDWKLLTFFLAANNICCACEGRDECSLPYYETQLRAALAGIQQRIPRVFVNLVGIFNISGVWDAGQKSAHCKTIWSVDKHECFCLTTKKRQDLDAMDRLSVGYNAIMAKVAKEWQDKKNPNFTVSYQPGFSGIHIPDYGEPFLSQLDCFHPSLYADQAFSYLLWNNMNQPQGQKTVVPDPKHIAIICPGPDDFIK